MRKSCLDYSIFVKIVLFSYVRRLYREKKINETKRSKIASKLRLLAQRNIFRVEVENELVLIRHFILRKIVKNEKAVLQKVIGCAVGHSNSKTWYPAFLYQTNFWLILPRHFYKASSVHNICWNTKDAIINGIFLTKNQKEDDRPKKKKILMNESIFKQ